MIGTTVSHYRIEEQLGQGGMGVVYKAVDTRLDRTVAIKLLPPHLSGDKHAMQRFMAEAKAASALEDQHICTIHDIGETEDGRSFIVMGYYDGQTLKYRMAGEALPLEDAISVGRQLAHGLAAAHAAGIVHRDVKPANIMVTSAGQVRLLDFGIAKFESSVDLTKEGTSVGTAAYMSPEQSRGESVDGRADIWSVGAVMYEMLGGKPPFAGGYEAALLYAILHDEPPPLEGIRPDLDPALCAVVTKCLAKDPADRFVSAEALWEALIPFAPLTTETRISSTAARAPDATAMIRTAAYFCGAAAFVLLLVYGAMIGLGLPSWLFPTGVILMLVGFPIVLYAVHTEKSRARLDSKERARLSGLRSWITTRRAVRGGFAAMGGLLAITAMFMILRSMGVGPFATLITAGHIDNESVVVVADFENKTDNPALGKSVAQAFRIDLSQSSAVNLMDGSRVTASLVRMQRDPGSPLSAELAREVAIREGAKGYIVGDIAPIGSGYVLTAGLHLASDGSQLVGLRESAKSDADILTSIDRLSARLREKVGESLVDIRGDKPLFQVSTRSLEALQLYSDAEFLTTQTDDRGAIRKLEEALALDSTFAMAWRKLGIIRNNLGDPEPQRRQAAQKAFENRANATERERLKIDALYYSGVVVDRERARTLYETLLEKWPYDRVGLINLQLRYNSLGRFAETEEMSRRALESNDGWVFRNALVRSLQFQGKYVEANEELASWARAFPRDGRMTGRELTQAFLDGRPDTLRILIDSLRARIPGADAERAWTNTIMFWAADTGHYREYMDARARDARIDAERGAPSSVLGGALSRAMYLIRTVRDAPAAKAVIEEALVEIPFDSLSIRSRPYVLLADVYTRLGELSVARELLDAYDRTVPIETRGDDRYYRYVRALNKVVDGAAAEGISDNLAVFEGYYCNRLCNMRIGELYAIAGQTDEAIAALELAVNIPDGSISVNAGTTSLAFETLGDLFATTGNLDKAIEYLSRFVDWWKDADPELQPRVQAALDRIDELIARKNSEPSTVG